MWIHLLPLGLIDGAGATVEDAPQSYSGEVVVHKPYYVRRGKKIILFANAADADAFIDAENQAEKSIKKARDKAKTPVYEVVQYQEIEFDLLNELTKRYAIPADVPKLFEAHKWDMLAHFAVVALRMQDEDDIECLLLC